VFAVLALAHDDLLVRTVIMPKFQLSVGLIKGEGTEEAIFQTAALQGVL
jgi:hypothetical protein